MGMRTGFQGRGNQLQVQKGNPKKEPSAATCFSIYGQKPSQPRTRTRVPYRPRPFATNEWHLPRPPPHFNGPSDHSTLLKLLYLVFFSVFHCALRFHHSNNGFVSNFTTRKNFSFMKFQPFRGPFIRVIALLQVLSLF